LAIKTNITVKGDIMAKTAFIGLGVMGYPMAGYLASRGDHDVCVYNRTGSKAEKWVSEFGGRSAPTPAEAARDADYVFACVGNDDDVRSVTTGPDGAFASMKSGALFVDHTTVSAKLAQELDAAAKSAGLRFLDAPVSGGQAGAEAGKLTVMVGGDAADFAQAEPVIGCYSHKIGLIGEAGAGQMAKMMNQICIAGLVQGLAEAIHLGQQSGMDVSKVIAAISGGAAQSWQMENRWETMAQGEYGFGFAVDWMRKDLAICLEQANEVGARLPVTALVDQFYGDVQEMGGNRWDTSSLLSRLTKPTD
jgi:3-hydroxyisobutyrate dehydrogenase-like beta-hydroxyacid dehydrogenase